LYHTTGKIKTVSNLEGGLLGEVIRRCYRLENGINLLSTTTGDAYSVSIPPSLCQKTIHLLVLIVASITFFQKQISEHTVRLYAAMGWDDSSDGWL